MSLEAEIDLSNNFLENNESSENENIIMKILLLSGFVVTQNISELNGIMIPRNLLINDDKYEYVTEYLEKLKKHKLFSSTFLTEFAQRGKRKAKMAVIKFSKTNIKS